MTYFHPIEKTKEFSEQAMAAIGTYGLLPTPENYELWFVYYSEAEPEVKNAIDHIIDEKAIDDEMCSQIYQKFLNSDNNSKVVESAGNQIQKTIHDVTEAVSQANEWTEGYNETLAKTKEGLGQDKTREEINEMLSDMLEETTGMIDKNVHMEELLKRSTKVMEDMQRDLEIARKEAITDSLTGLANRKSFDLEIQRLSNTVVEGECATFTLLMLDIDHFKSFNDDFGHQVGDQVLKLVAKTLKDGVKGRDLACRYGGEEFAILLPDTPLEGGAKVAEYIRKEVASKDIINRATGERIARITISIGVAEYNTDEKLDLLISRADDALYMAKDAGRNKVKLMSLEAALQKKS